MLKIDWLSGTCPVQAEGTVDGLPFYFRARGDAWTFSVANSADGNPVEVWAHPEQGYHIRGPYGEPGGVQAGYMPHEEAQGFIEQAAKRFLQKRELHKIGKLYPFGYAAPGSMERLEALMAEEYMLIVDIRYSPHSRWQHQWEGPEIQRRFLHRTEPIARYTWLQALGNVNYRVGGKIQLANAAEGLAFLVDVLSIPRNVVLLCACKDYERCHRKTVVELVKQQLPDVEVVL